MKLNELNLHQAINGLQKKQFSSVEITQACLDQIKQTNQKLNSVITINEEALHQAKKDDTTKPLGGIPYLLKDNFLTTDIRTTASSKVLDNFIPAYDATVYAKLKAAGAILLGKTNMDAWAHGSSTETSDYGSTKNPWNTNHLPGGSSGGSAAGVASDQCIFAIGSETAGSIRQPAAWCGVTGFKPTYGRVSRYGVIAMASSTDSPGPMTKNITDAAIITQIIAGRDPHDATTSPKPVDVNPDRLIHASLKDKKIGLPKQYLLPEMRSEVIKVIKTTAKKLEELGARVEEVDLIDPHYAIGVYTVVQRSEVSSNLGRYDGVRYGNPRDHFGAEAKRRIMLGTFALSAGYYDQYYNKAQKVRTLIIKDFDQVFSKYDLIIGPVSPGPALKVGASVDQPMFGELEDILVEASSIAGLTGLSVPCGFVDGLPIGLQITGPQFAEQQVLEAGYAYQQATDFHLQKPKL